MNHLKKSTLFQIISCGMLSRPSSSCSTSLQQVSHPHTHGARIGPLFPRGAVRVGAAWHHRYRHGGQRLLVETLASCGSPLSSRPLITDAPAGRRTWPTALPNAKEAGAETCTVPATEGRSTLASGQRGGQGAHRVSKKRPSTGPRTQFQNDELAPISPINPRIAHQHHRRPMHGQFSRLHTDELRYITHCATMLNRF